MDVLFAIIVIIMASYTVGSLVTSRRIKKEALRRRCQTCKHIFPISASTKKLMHEAYQDKCGCSMHRGISVPVGTTGCTLSVVNKDSFCDQWRQRHLNG